MGSHVVRQIELTSLEADHILTALRGFYAKEDEYEWCSICSAVTEKVLPIAQADGFKLTWEDPSVYEGEAKGRSD